MHRTFWTKERKPKIRYSKDINSLVVERLCTRSPFKKKNNKFGLRIPAESKITYTEIKYVFASTETKIFRDRLHVFDLTKKDENLMFLCPVLLGICFWYSLCQRELRVNYVCIWQKFIIIWETVMVEKLSQKREKADF